MNFYICPKNKKIKNEGVTCYPVTYKKVKDHLMLQHQVVSQNQIQQ